MDIYVDLDDCLCETGRYFAKLAAELFGKDVAYEDMRFFELRRAFSLTDGEFERLMEEGHRPEALLALEETPGASAALNTLMDRGHRVSVITGRWYGTYGPSRAWLDRRGLGRARLYCFNKYGREGFEGDRDRVLEPEDFRRMRFDYAVEDSPSAFRLFDHLPEMKVLVFDRPWNRECVFPREGYTRCSGWDTIRDMILEETV